MGTTWSKKLQLTFTIWHLNSEFIRNILTLWTEYTFILDGTDCQFSTWIVLHAFDTPKEEKIKRDSKKEQERDFERKSIVGPQTTF